MRSNDESRLHAFLLGRGPDERLTDVALLLLRLVFGLSMALTHGLGTLSNFLDHPTEFPDPLGLGPTLSVGLMAFAELVCALALAAGVLGRLAAFPLVFGLGTAFFVFHAGDPFGHKELALLYLCAFTVVLVAGPGRFSVDALLARWWRRRHRRLDRKAPLAVVGLLAVSAASAGGCGTGDGAASGTLESFHRAEALVREALEATGGEDALREAGGVSLVGRGTLDLGTRMQGMHPDRPDPVPVEERLAVDLAEDRLAYETHGRVNPDADEWIRYLYDGDRMLVVLRLSGQAFWVPGNEDHERRYRRIVPHLLLRDALDRRRTLRHLDHIDGREAASFVLASGEEVTLLFDPETRRLRGFEYLLDLPLRGDTPVRWQLDEYRDVEGIGPYPAGYRIELGDRLLKEIRYEAIRAGARGAELFEEPEGIRFPEPPPPPEPGPEDQETAAEALPEVRTLADGVYLAMGVRDGFHVLFVELEDFVVVVDAPAGYHELQMVPAIDWAGDVTSSSVGRRLLETVRATVPDKPVRYLVLTHHHGDHAGGVRPFLAAGATVLTSAVTKPVIERAARARFRLEPDELTGRTIEPRIEVVDGERAISDGRRTVRVLDVGPNPHAEGMLVVHLPEHGILYQSDLFMPSGGGFPDPARIPVMKWFVDWLDRSGIDPETIYAIHGSARVTDEQLRTIRSLE